MRRRIATLPGRCGDFALPASAKQIKPPGWHFPAIELFMESQTPETTLVATAEPADRCEAPFFVGEWYLLHGKRAEATATLNAAATCPKQMLTSQSAQMELKRLPQ